MAEQFDDVVLRIPMRPGGPVGPGRRGRGPWYAWSFVGVLIAIVGLALLGDDPGDRSPRPSDAAVSAPSSGSDPGSLDPPEPIASEILRPTLPDYPNLAIAGAPGIGLARPAGNDLELSAWWPGDDALEPVGLVRGVFTAGDPFRFVDMSPNLRYGVTIGPASSVENVIVARLFGHDGILWTSLTAGPGAVGRDPGPYLALPAIVWAPDNTAVAVGAGPAWTVIRIDGTEVSAQGVRVGRSADPPGSPGPEGDRSGEIVPVAFSADSRWLYGASVDESVPTFKPAVRIDLAAPELMIEPIARFPAAGPEALAPTRFPGPGIDPSTGRHIELVGSEPGDVELALFDADGAPLPLPDGIAGRFVSTAWLGGGRLFAMREVVTDERWSLAIDWGTVERDGMMIPWQAVDGRLTRGSVIAGRSGFALFDLRAGAEEMLVMMRVDDGATGTLHIPPTRPRAQTWAYMIDPRTGP
jgi:hypothetical protein